MQKQKVFLTTAIFVIILVMLGVGGYFIFQKHLPPKIGKSAISNSELAGFWQNCPSVAAGYCNRYHFYSNGNFEWYANQMACFNGILAQKGTWKISNGKILLTLSKQFYGQAPCGPDALPAKITPPVISKSANLSISDIFPTDTTISYYKYILIDNQKFYQLSNDPTFNNSEDQQVWNQNNQTADWKTYIDNKYGFQLEYPKDWNIVSGEKRSDGEFAFCNQDLIASNSQCQPVFSVDVPNNSRGISLYILDAQKVQSKYGIHVEIPGVWWDKTKNRLYELSYSDYSANIPPRTDDNARADAFNKIVSTFKLVTPTSQTADWKTYSGYGISFKYPAAIGEPQIHQLSTKTSIGFKNGAVEFDIGTYYNQTLGRNMTIDEIANSTAIHQNAVNIKQKDIIVDGKKGIELDYTDSVSGGGTTEIYFPIDENGNILMAYQYGRATVGMAANLFDILPTLNFTDSTAGWKIYSDNQNGFEFQYPTSINPNGFATLNAPQVIAGDYKHIAVSPSTGCFISSDKYTPPNPIQKGNKVLINSIPFCVSTMGDAAMGHNYTTYFYTTTKDNGQNYITVILDFGEQKCDNLLGGPNYQLCLDFAKNFDLDKTANSNMSTIK
ncbi:MAG: hypothetical protein NTV36_02820 [Candidatus Staskawiczbacteria bacterium]|nr:hypothetical protein [Candidatus Staskawiczbacteria bacterium]